jgi:hypothetical protein
MAYSERPNSLQELVERTVMRGRTEEAHRTPTVAVQQVEEYEPVEQVVEAYVEDDAEYGMVDPSETPSGLDIFNPRDDEAEEIVRKPWPTRRKSGICLAAGLAIVGTLMLLDNAPDEKAPSAGVIQASPTATAEPSNGARGHQRPTKPAKNPTEAPSTQPSPSASWSEGAMPSASVDTVQTATVSPDPEVTLPPAVLPIFPTEVPTQAPEVVKPVAIKVMAENVLGSSHTDGNDANHPEYGDSTARMAALIEIINDRQPDLIAFSELEPSQRNQLQSNNRFDSDYVILPRQPDYGTDTNMSVNSIAVRVAEGRFNIVNESSRPFEYFSPGLNRLPVVRLEDRQNNNFKLSFSPLHDPATTPGHPNMLDERDRNVERHVDFAKGETDDGYGSIITGDLNSSAVVRNGIDYKDPAKLPCKEMTVNGVLNDAFDLFAGGTGNCKTAGEKDSNAVQRTFVTKAFSVLNWVRIINPNTADISDHYPLITEVIPKEIGAN